MELLLTERCFDAKDAYHWGLVNRVVPANRLMEETWEMARLLGGDPPLVQAITKEIVRDAEEKNVQDAMNKINARQ